MDKAGTTDEGRGAGGQVNGINFKGRKDYLSYDLKRPPYSIQLSNFSVDLRNRYLFFQPE